jgi:large subunit ribosomal protein L25
MPEVRIVAERRTEFGKGAARRTRRADKVPAVLYGHGSNPQHISLPGHALMRALKTHNVLLELDIAGSTLLALPKDIQRDPIKGFLEHVDLLIVRRGEKVTVDVVVLTEGEAAPDTMVTHDANSIEVEAEATNIPTELTVSIAGLPAGTQIHAKDVSLTEGTTLVSDPETLVVNITAAQTAEQAEAELAELEAEAGIEHEAPAAAETDGAGPAAGDAARESESTGS